MFAHALWRIAHAAAATALVGVTTATLRAQPTTPTAAMVASGVVPGQRMRVTLRASGDSTATAADERQLEGRLVDLDTTGVILRLKDGSLRQFGRAEVGALRAYAGRSHWSGLLAGWLISLPVALVACVNAENECLGGSLIGFVGGTAGAVIGWPRWKRVQFPALRLPTSRQ